MVPLSFRSEMDLFLLLLCTCNAWPLSILFGFLTFPKKKYASAFYGVFSSSSTFFRGKSVE